MKSFFTFLSVLALVVVLAPMNAHAIGNVIVNFSVTPTVLGSGGGTVTITWSSSGAGCVGTNFNTDGATNGSVRVSTTVTKDYSITCTEPEPPVTSKKVSQTVTVTTAPYATLTGSPTVTVGGPGTLMWSSLNVASCTGTGFSTGGAPSGTAPVSPTTNTTYSVNCGGATASFTMTVLTPTATLTVSPASINQGANSLLTWSSTNVSSCTGTNFSTGNAVSGSVSVTPSTTTTYSVTCGTATANVSRSCTPPAWYCDDEPYSDPSYTDFSASCEADDRYVYDYGPGVISGCFIGEARYYSSCCTISPQPATATVTVILPLSGAVVSCSASPTSVNINQSVTWTASVTGGTPPYTYEWSGDNLAGLTGISTIISYLSAGLKSGSIKVTDSSSIPSSTTVNSTWTWGIACSGTPTGYGYIETEDSPTFLYWRPWFENSSKYVAPPPADFAVNPQNYCVQGHIITSSVPYLSGLYFNYLSLDVYSGSGTVIKNPDTIVNGSVYPSTQYQGVYGARVWTVTNTPSSGPAIVTKQCSNTVIVNGGPTTPTFAAPGLTCPASVIVNQAASFTLSASDPNGDQIHYGMDWDNTSTVDEWKPSATTYVASGVSQTFQHTWNSAGAYTIQGLAEDTGGNKSGWAECTVNVGAVSQPQCSDTINNDSDAWTDYPADPGCTSLIDPTENPNPQCSDGISNDTDGLIDSADPGCHTNGDPNQPYDPRDNDESTPMYSPQCSDGVNNDGVNGADAADPACHTNNDLLQPYDPNDDNESLPQPSLSLTVLLGNRILPQTRATILWTTAGVKPGTCSVTGDNLPQHDQWFGNAGQQQTSILSNQTVYTLRCLDLASVATSTSTTVEIAPSSGEE